MTHSSHVTHVLRNTCVTCDIHTIALSIKTYTISAIGNAQSHMAPFLYIRTRSMLRHNALYVVANCLCAMANPID